MTILDLQADQEAYELAVSAVSHDAGIHIPTAVAELFDKNVNLGAIEWLQYHNFFDDGEPSLFEVKLFSAVIYDLDVLEVQEIPDDLAASPDYIREVSIFDTGLDRKQLPFIFAGEDDVRGLIPAEAQDIRLMATQPVRGSVLWGAVWNQQVEFSAQRQETLNDIRAFRNVLVSFPEILLDLYGTDLRIRGTKDGGLEFFEFKDHS